MKRFAAALVPVWALLLVTATCSGADSVSRQPVLVVLYSRFYDHGHPSMTDDRLKQLLPMLDRLHTMLPHAVFATVLRNWPRLHRFGTVHRSEWVRYLNRVSGRDLTAFVHRWLDSQQSPA